LIRTRNKVAQEIAALIGRPALIGHIGEYIASRVFGIELEESASQRGLDGRFVTGPLAGQSVNIKWHSRQDGLLDLTPDTLPDFYLVLAGPRGEAASSRGTVRPWVIETVYLFASSELSRTLKLRGVKMGVATSVVRQLWDEAEIYPEPRNKRLVVLDEQREVLALFGSE
jgi:hypothetical protein